MITKAIIIYVFYIDMAELVIISSNQDVIIVANGTCKKCLALKLDCEVLHVIQISNASLKQWQKESQVKMVKLKCICN
jgi:hypothetical protein